MAFDQRLTIRAEVAGKNADTPRLKVDLAFAAGITAVTGPSGAGKSTLLAAIAGLLRPSAGLVTLDGTTLFDGAQRVFVAPHRRGVAIVFQSLALFSHMSALDNVAYGVRANSRQRRREVAQSWLARAHIVDVAERRPETLSGGEAQRVALARALASSPQALLLDEPFSALDRALRRDLSAELRELVRELDIPVVLVTHDEEDAAELGSRQVHLGAGQARL